MTTKISNKTENSITRLISIFYIAIGITEVAYFVIENFAAPLHILILGILSLITAYSFFTMKKWTLPLVIGIFFVGVTFGAATLSNSIELQTFGGAMLFHTALIVYMILLLIVTVYVVAKRKDFNL